MFLLFIFLLYFVLLYTVMVHITVNSFVRSYGLGDFPVKIMRRHSLKYRDFFKKFSFLTIGVKNGFKVIVVN